MFKKNTALLLILLTLFISINICNALPENEEEVKDVAHEFIDKLFSNTFFENIKEAYNENIAIHYVKMSYWFKENIQPKLENSLNKVMSNEEYSKEKEEIKNELPNILEEISNFFKNLKN